MATVSITHLILFIAAIVLAASVAITTVSQGDIVAQAVADAGLDRRQEVKTDIEIITDPSGPVYDRDNEGNITLHITNAGTQSLPTDPATFDVLVNGTYVTEITVTPLDGTLWWPDDVIRLEISVPNLGTGDHRVKVAVDGDADVFTFRV